MIITKLIGGLGNQMFQYAAGRRAAYVNNTELKLDISGYKHQKNLTKRQYLLNIFNIHEKFASPIEIFLLTFPERFFIRKHLTLFHKLTSRFCKQKYISQIPLQFDQRALAIKNNTYLEGFWGSEKYFIDIKEIIYQEFCLKNKPDSFNEQIINKITHSNSVALHVRRGDYVSDRKTHEFHGLCSSRYYFHAIKLITSKINNPHFFIFSDDLEWVKKNIKLKYPTNYVVHNYGKQDHEDLRLMSNCCHNIIANSSFSWWGAWLNQNPQKIVIVPKYWFKDKSISTKYLIPKSWKRL